jgi:hypothetical protein
MWRIVLCVLLIAGLGRAQTSSVVIVHDPLTNVRAMVRAGLTQLTGLTNETAAWQTFAGSNDVVGIKISTLAAPLHVTHPDLIEAIVDGLQQAGVAATNIIVFDRDPRKLADAEYNSPHFKPVAITSPAGGGWDADAFIDNRVVGKLIHGDLQFGKDEALGTRTHFPVLVTRRLTKLINVPVAMDHEATGIAGCLYNVSLGMTDNTRRFEQFGQRGDPAIAEIHARPVLRGKLVLQICDALVAGFAGGHAGLFSVRFDLLQ